MRFAAPLPKMMQKLLQEYMNQSEEHLVELVAISSRILSSAQLIDFYVHDMLDLVVLTEKRENFTMSIE